MEAAISVMFDDPTVFVPDSGMAVNDWLAAVIEKAFLEAIGKKPDRMTISGFTFILPADIAETLIPPP